MRRAALSLAGAYLLIAVVIGAAENLGAMTCGCAEACWCQRRGLGLFRWVFPWRHRTTHPADEVTLDPAPI